MSAGKPVDPMTSERKPCSAGCVPSFGLHDLGCPNAKPAEPPKCECGHSERAHEMDDSYGECTASKCRCDRYAPKPAEPKGYPCSCGDSDEPNAIHRTHAPCYSRPAEPDDARYGPFGDGVSMTQVFVDSFGAVCAERDALKAEVERLRVENAELKAGNCDCYRTHDDYCTLPWEARNK